MNYYYFEIDIPKDFFVPFDSENKFCYITKKIFEVFDAPFGKFEVDVVSNKLEVPPSTTVCIQLEDNKSCEWSDATIQFSFIYQYLTSGLSYYSQFDDNILVRKFHNSQELLYNNKMPQKIVVAFKGTQVLTSKIAFDPSQDCKNHYEFLFKDNYLTDIVIKAEDQQLKAHKIILARSPVIKKLIESMDESICDLLVLSDIKYEVLKDLVCYLYYDHVGNMKKNALELLIAGEKYEVLNLVYECKNYLFNNINLDNFADIFITTAKKSHVDDLKQKVIDFIIEHGHNLLATEGWLLLKSHPELMTEITEQIFYAQKS